MIIGVEVSSWAAFMIVGDLGDLSDISSSSTFSIELVRNFTSIPGSSLGLRLSLPSFSKFNFFADLRFSSYNLL